MNAPVEIRFTVPGNPVPKGRARSRIVTAKDGRQFVTHYTPPKTESEEAVIRYYASQEMAGRELMSGPLAIHICVYRAIPASWSHKKIRLADAGELFPVIKPDYDNYAKMQDALNKVIWNDDAQIVDAHIYKRYSSRPRISVIVKQKLSPGGLNV
jgi:Holliday junction resolvase RusA-like endonuclease